MAKPSLCRLIAALLCAIALIGGIQAEISSAAAKVEARNDEAVMEMAQQQAPAKTSPMKANMSHMPVEGAEVDKKMDVKPAKSVGQEAAAKPMAAAVVGAADNEKENMEILLNAEVLKQPSMARLARRLKSFHNYQLRRAQSRAANNIQDEYDDEDNGIVPEERAIRRRQRIRRRKVNNRLRRTNRRKNVSQRRQNSNQRQSVRRPSMKKTSYRRRGNNRGDGNKKSSKPRRSNKKRRSGQKKSTRKTKQKSSKSKRTKKGRKSNRRKTEDDNFPRQQASQMIVFVDGVPVAAAA